MEFAFAVAVAVLDKVGGLELGLVAEGNLIEEVDVVESGGGTGAVEVEGDLSFWKILQNVVFFFFAKLIEKKLVSFI